MKSFFSSVVMAALCLGSFAFVSCDKEENKTTSQLSFSATKTEVQVGAAATVTVKNGTQPYTVKSSDEKIATVKVDKATITVTGVAAGKATITVTDKNKLTGTISVEVKASSALAFDKTSVNVAVGKEGTVAVKNGTQPYTVKSGDEKIATVKVDKATITVKGVKAGSTTITVTDKDSKSGKINVVVK